MKILESKKADVEIIDYMKNPLDEATLRSISKKLGMPPKDFIRKKESVFKELNLKERLDDNDELFRQMTKYPKLIERPIAVKGNKAVLGRPTEKILEILK